MVNGHMPGTYYFLANDYLYKLKASLFYEKGKNYVDDSANYFVIIPQIIVIIASSLMKNDQSIILNIGGSIGIICGLIALVLIYQNKINVTEHIISIFLVILISIIITFLSFLHFHL